MEQSCLPHLQLVILLLLMRAGPMCGYRIAKTLNDVLGLDVDEASVYNVLGKLARRGLLKPIRDREGGRVVVRYEVTSEGRERVCRLLELLEKINTAVLRAVGAGEEVEPGVSWAPRSLVACEH